MTITLQVREVLENPTPFVKGYRLAVIGVLFLSDDDFRILQSDQLAQEIDKHLSLRIDDPLAIAGLRAVLPVPSPGSWWYFGLAMVEAWTRCAQGEWLLHEVVSIWLDGQGGEGFKRVSVRSHPWGWDQFL